MQILLQLLSIESYIVSFLLACFHIQLLRINCLCYAKLSQPNYIINDFKSITSWLCSLAECKLHKIPLQFATMIAALRAYHFYTIVFAQRVICVRVYAYAYAVPCICFFPIIASYEAINARDVKVVNRTCFTRLNLIFIFKLVREHQKG